MQDPGIWFLGGRTSSMSYFCILLSWCGSCGTFQGCLAELQWWLSAVSGNVHVAVGVQVIGGKSHLPGNGCAEHCWVSHLPCIIRALEVVWYEIQSVVRLSDWSVYQQVSSTVPLQSFIWHQCKGIMVCIESLCMHIAWKVQYVGLSLGRRYGCCCWPRISL